MEDKKSGFTETQDRRSNHISYRQIGQILIEAGMINREQLAKAVAGQPEGKRKKLGDLLIDLGYFTESQYLMALCNKLNCRVVNFQEIAPDAKALAALPAQVARDLQICPVEDRDGQLVVARSHPEAAEIEATLQNYTHRDVTFVMATSHDIAQALDKYYPRETDAGSDELALQVTADEETEEDMIDVPREIDSEIVKLVNKILADAHAKRVSDIHFDCGIKGKPSDVRFRVDGICHSAYIIPEKFKRGFISRIKIISNLDIAERRRPQSGKFMVNIRGEKVEFRVEITPTVDNNENAVLRILAKSKPAPIDTLGLSAHNLEIFGKMISRPQGVVLCVGPTGSGKTTTLHAALGHINQPQITIWTAEDPVEIRQAGLKQVQVNPKIGYTFSEALRSFLRADPDVIMIGEMRDVETAKITMEASLTGHLVFSTLHTNSAAETIVRIIDMGIPFYHFADALLGIVAQRLTRRLCENCKKPYHPDREEYDRLINFYDPVWAKKHELPGYTSEFTLWMPQGCSRCEGKGYYDRIAIHEIIEASAPVKNAIRHNVDIGQLTNVALENGMRTLRMDGVMKILQGITDYEQVARVCL